MILEIQVILFILKILWFIEKKHIKNQKYIFISYLILLTTIIQHTFYRTFHISLILLDLCIVYGICHKIDSTKSKKKSQSVYPQSFVNSKFV